MADLHDLTSRNQGNGLKPDMSSMYHHHMMQGRQPHPSDMHDFLSADPMAATLPAALGLATGSTDGGPHHGGSSVGNQLHAPLYSSHHHGAMNSKWNSSQRGRHWWMLASTSSILGNKGKGGEGGGEGGDASELLTRSNQLFTVYLWS